MALLVNNSQKLDMVADCVQKLSVKVGVTDGRIVGVLGELVGASQKLEAVETGRAW